MSLSMVIEQVCSLPAATEENWSAEETYVGEARAVVLPSPSFPLLLSPQHTMELSSSTAQVCIPPDAMAVAVRPAGSSVWEGE
jgi:hypothetical protein